MTFNCGNTDFSLWKKFLHIQIDSIFLTQAEKEREIKQEFLVQLGEMQKLFTIKMINFKKKTHTQENVSMWCFKMLLFKLPQVHWNKKKLNNIFSIRFVQFCILLPSKFKLTHPIFNEYSALFNALSDIFNGILLVCLTAFEVWQYYFLHLFS